MDWPIDSVREPSGTRDPAALLQQPTSVLLGVSETAAEALKHVGITTVFDLGSSELFANARDISLLAEDGEGSFAAVGRVPSGALRNGADTPLSELPGAAISMLVTALPSSDMDDLAKALDVATIHDLAVWPPYRTARELVDRVYNPLPPPGLRDQGTPQDLLPANGQYPTERVQYEVLLFDSFVGKGGAAHDLAGAGQLDVTHNGSEVEGYTRPAIGGVLTYTQSWYTKGLSLGHLIHGVALGPGETTKIAVIDWARRVLTQATEAIDETEQLDEDLARSRSIGEITSAVARETQSGRSAASSEASATQRGGSSAGANLRDFDPFEAFLMVQSPGVSTSGSSFGTASGSSDATSWSTTSGRRDVGASLAQDIVDRTHQAAHSARNRRASIVREVSQQESESISTRSLTNYNHMHALTVEYYEVVQLYRTVVQLSKADRCLFVPLMLLDFRDPKVVDRYRTILLGAALSPIVREALELPASTIRVKDPAVATPELQAGEVAPDAVDELAQDKWLAQDVGAARIATGGQIRVLGDGRLALPGDAVLSGVEFMGQTAVATDGGTNASGFFTGRQIVPVAGTAPTRSGLKIQKGSLVHLSASGRVTFASPDPGPDGGFFAASSTQKVLGSEVKDTGLRIQKGSRVSMTTADSIKHAHHDPKNWDADGSADPAPAGWYAPGMNQFSLVCRIDGKYYQGGVDTSFIAATEGNLFMLVNDTIGGLGDNEDFWTVSLDVHPPSNVPTQTSFDANGFSATAGTEFYAPGLREYSLICRVGTSDWAPGGTSTEFTATQDGELILQPNDVVDDLENNTGSWQVTVDVTEPAPDTPSAATADSITVAKRTGGNVTVTKDAAGWPVDQIRMRLDDIEALAIAVTDAQSRQFGFLALTFTFQGRDFRIVFPVRLHAHGSATVFYTDLPTDLVSHLMDHRLFYSQAVWRSLDPATIGTLLSDYVWQLGGKTRRLIEIVDPSPVAVVANYLVLRLSGDVADEYNAWLKRSRIQVGSSREDQVPIPTGGVFAEAVLGRANSAEQLDLTRFWDWQESPIPIEAPEIAPVQSDSRRDTDTTVPGRLDQPVLNIVNPPALPDPQGMNAILAAIQNGTMFRDMSGLAATIGLAQAGLAGAEQGAGQAAAQAGDNAAVAAQLGAQVAEIAGKIIAAYLSGGGSLLAGGGGGGGGIISGKGGNSKTGSILNYARDMDARGGATGGSATPAPATGGAGANGAGGGGVPGTAADRQADAGTTGGSWEDSAMLASLGAGPFSYPSAAIKTILGASGADAGTSYATSTAWPKLDRVKVLDRLKELHDDPNRFDQGPLGLCTAAAFYHHIIQRKALEFYAFGKSLYVDGIGFLGDLKVAPGDDVRRADYTALFKGKASAPPQADWMLMSALRDSQNVLFDFEGAADESTAMITSARELSGWYERTGFYSDVSYTSQFFVGLLDASLSDIKAIKKTATNHVALWIDIRLIHDQRGGSHMMTLESPLVIDEANNRVTCDYWTWGQPVKSLAATLDSWEKYYYGAITATF
jgi:hypothetical protein